MRNRTENKITLVMIRHGATKSNREHRYLGKTEEDLSKQGVRELIRYKELQCYPRVDCLFASPMRRCLQTAELLYPERKPVCIPEWTEMDFGAFEGKNYAELQDDRRYQEWLDSGGKLPFPEGEGREEFILRCGRGLSKMTEQVEAGRGRPETIGMVVHGGTIMALLSRYYGGEYFDYQAANGRGYLCTYHGRGNGPGFSELKKI